jgi:hypothetical protein
MHGLTNGQLKRQGFVRSALFVTACVFVVALLLMPIAATQTGTGGLLGLLATAAICLLSAYVAEGINCVLSRAGSHLAAMLFSMAVRFTPPLAVCFVLAATGASGRQHLAFVFYLLAFYLATLAVETWLAVQRVSDQSPNLEPNSR